jgi:formylglycine-generating enzyme required for sulfatase activity
MTIIQKPEVVQMGSPEKEKGRDANDEPLHSMRIGRGFAIATKKVTVRQFKEFWKSRHKEELEREAIHIYSPDPDDPVLAVSWYEAAMYCNWLSEQEGIPEDQWCYPKEIKEGMVMTAGYLSRTGYRLPTEAEWEYACRAGSTTRRPYGSADQLLGKYAWHRDGPSNQSKPVGQLKPNDLGLFDALGNTWDWCQDGWRKADSPPAEDRETPGTVNKDQPRQTRGGSYANPASEVRSAGRNPNLPDYQSDPIGIRVARTLP